MNNKLEKFFSENKREKLIIAIAIIIIILLLLIGLVVANNVNSLDDYDMSSVTFTDSTVAYDGEEHSLEIDGDLPDGVSVSYTYDGADVSGETAAGTYDVVASFTGDITEYNAISDMEATLTISNATIDTTGITFEGVSYAYDGEEHSLEIDGDLPDGVNVSYTYDGANVSGETAIGTYAVVATLSEDNYATKTLSATLKITEGVIDTKAITFEDKSYSYDGDEHSIKISGDLPDGVSVSYTYDGANVSGETAIGVYAVVATLSEDNYTTQTLSATLTITEALEYTYTVNEDETSVTLTAYLGSSTDITTPTTITDDGTTYSVTAIGDKCFSPYVEPSPYSESSETANCENGADIKSVVISSGVTSIGDSCFEGCTSLTSVTIPSTITDLASYCFEGCTSLTSVTIPDSVTTYGIACFEGCTSLGSLTISENVVNLSKFCFEGCTSLKSLTIPKSVTNVGNSCFYGCTSLTSISYEDGITITSIADACFYKCTSLKSITIPDSVKTLATNCFAECTSLISITIPDSVSTIEKYCFYNCTSLATVTFEDGCSITAINASCFYNCISLTSITIPSTVQVLRSSCFSGCTKLATVTLSSSLWQLSDSCFEDCTSLKSITIPSKVTLIQNNCFSGCTSLTSVTFEDESYEWEVSNSSTGTTKDLTVSNDSTNATNLADTYSEYFWNRKSE